MKIAIVKLSALGDIVHAMVALQFIKAAYPDAQIDWVVEQGFAGVLADNPDINQILTVNLKAVKTNKRRLLSEIANIQAYSAQHYDWVIDAQGLIKSALVARLLSKQCVGFDKHSIRESLAARFYKDTVACAYDANTIDRNVAVLTRPLGLNISSAQILEKRTFLYFQPSQLNLPGYGQTGLPSVLLVTGSTWPSRNYPKENYLKVVQGLNANCLLLWGNSQEHESAKWIAERSNAKVLPRMTLNDLKAQIASADLIIGNDTGPTHMAWGLNRPSITLFGPTPISRVYQTDINKVLKSPSVVNPYKLDKNDFSIAEIAETEIIRLAEELL
ncbi:lipopolysaccharide heptosyltransferase I [Methylomonas sp. AM2-LC]|uniref:lipopolysaccharide heptosyltransferase I n=1 Tax=Methylomonas sp. AM2-LC TaxID=3153301 RepID=UPI003267DC3B